LKGKYDKDIGETMDDLLDNIEKKIAATKLQASFRGHVSRDTVKNGNFSEERRRETEKAALKGAGQLKAQLLLQRLMRGAIARRRVRKAKEARRKELLEKGMKDDTKDNIYTVVFEGEGGLGFKLRDCSEENLVKAKEVRPSEERRQQV